MSWVKSERSTDLRTLARVSSLSKSPSDTLPSLYKTIATSSAEPDPPSVNSKILFSFAAPWVTPPPPVPDKRPLPEPSFIFSKEVSIAPRISEDEIPAPVKSIEVPEDVPFWVTAVLKPTTSCATSKLLFLLFNMKSAEIRSSVPSEPVDEFAELVWKFN